MTLSSSKREGGISLEMLQWKRVSSYIEGRISWFFPSCHRKLEVLLNLKWDLLLMLPVENLVSMRVGRSLSGYLSIRCTGLGPHRELRLEPNCSSPVLTWISGFLWSFNRGIRPRHVQRDGKPLASRPVKIVSGFLSS